MNFFTKLLSTTGDVSSKRFSGLLLIGTFIVCTVTAVITGNITETVESLIKTGLYAGSGLLGVNVIPDVINTVKRSKVTEDEKPA